MSGGASFARLLYPDASLRVFPELVSESADGDAEDIRRMRAVPETMIERIENKIALDVRNRPSHQRARRNGRGFGDRNRIVVRAQRYRLKPRAIRQPDRFGSDLGSLCQQDSAMN